MSQAAKRRSRPVRASAPTRSAVCSAPAAWARSTAPSTRGWSATSRSGIYELLDRRLLREIQPADVDGIQTVHTVRLAPDGRSYVYGCFQQLSELYVAEGWR